MVALSAREMSEVRSLVVHVIHFAGMGRSLQRRRRSLRTARLIFETSEETLRPHRPSLIRRECDCAQQ